MFSLDTVLPGVQEIGRRVGLTRNLPPKVERKVQELSKELGQVTGLKRRNPLYCNAMTKLARAVHVDYDDSSKVYAVGLMALRRSKVIPTREHTLEFQMALEREQKARFQIPEMVSIEEVPVEFKGVVSTAMLDELEKIADDDRDTQLKRDLKEWIAKARAADDHKELVNELVDDILVDPVTYGRWEMPSLYNDGHTYSLASGMKLDISPFNREKLHPVRPHAAAFRALEWAARLMETQGSGAPCQSGV